MKIGTFLIPIAIALVLVALGVWPGKAIRSYRFATLSAKPRLMTGLIGEECRWEEKGEGYQSRNGPPIRHGPWEEVAKLPGPVVWRCEGEYEDGRREGRWTVERNGELVRETFFRDGRLVRIVEWKDGQSVEVK